MSVQYRHDRAVPNAIYLYDFGGAHGRQIYSNINDLIKDITAIVRECKLLDHKDGYFLYGMTNSGQAPQRKMLSDIGFVSTPIGNLVMHSITEKEFANAAEKAIKAAKEEEERIAAEKAKAEEARKARDLLDGRTPGELRVGDVVSYSTHTVLQKRDNPYVIVAIKGTQVAYTTSSSFAYYKLDYLAKAGNWMAANMWHRAEPSIEQDTIKRYPNIGLAQQPVEVKKPTPVAKKASVVNPMVELSTKESMKRTRVKKAS